MTTKMTHKALLTKQANGDLTVNKTSDNSDGTFKYVCYPPPSGDSIFNRRSMRGYRGVFGINEERIEKLGDDIVKAVGEVLDGLGL